MSTYALIHGAGGSARSWHLVVDELELARPVELVDHVESFGNHADAVDV